jgi:predicted dehydrogenase
LESQPSEVARNAAHYLQRDREDVAFLTLYYPNQVVANIHVSWLDPRKVRQATVVGNSKMALWDDINTTEPLRLYDKGGRPNGRTQPLANSTWFCAMETL